MFGRVKSYLYVVGLKRNMATIIQDSTSVEEGLALACMQSRITLTESACLTFHV